MRFSVSRPSGYFFPQVEAFVESAVQALSWWEKNSHEQATAIHSLQEELVDEQTRAANLQSQVELFRVQGDPLTRADGTYVTESDSDGSQQQILDLQEALSQAHHRAAEMEATANANYTSAIEQQARAEAAEAIVTELQDALDVERSRPAPVVAQQAQSPVEEVPAAPEPAAVVEPAFIDGEVLHENAHTTSTPLDAGAIDDAAWTPPSSPGPSGRTPLSSMPARAAVVQAEEVQPTFESPAPATEPAHTIAEVPVQEQPPTPPPSVVVEHDGDQIEFHDTDTNVLLDPPDYATFEESPNLAAEGTVTLVPPEGELPEGTVLPPRQPGNEQYKYHQVRPGDPLSAPNGVPVLDWAPDLNPENWTPTAEDPSPQE